MSRRVAFALSLSLAACQIDGSIGSDMERGGGSGGGSGMGDGADDLANTGDGTGAMSAGGSGGGASGSGPIDTVGETLDTSTDRPEVCHPVPDDNACAECRKMQCCMPLAQCLSHDQCICWWHCLTETDMTVELCDPTCDGGPELYFELATCVELSCDVCPPPMD